MTEAPWPEPIIAGPDHDAAAMVRRLWSRAERVDAVVADTGRLRELLGGRDGPEGPAGARLTREGPLRCHFAFSAGLDDSEFILFYAAGSAFPESAVMFTGGIGSPGWVTFHRRPLVLHRLRERFNRLYAGEGRGTVAGSVREQPLKDPRPLSAVSADAAAELVPPEELYRRVLAVHFSGFDGPSEKRRPDSAPALTAHQERAYERARDILDRLGGVIIADAVGLGKTYIGLRLLEHTLEFGGRALVVAPAALKDQWERELAYLGAYGGAPARGPDKRHPVASAENLDLWVREAGDNAIALLSTELLGRRTFDPGSYRGAELVVVDEAHNFRNPGTRRYRALSELVRHSRVALLTATPINNSVLDLQHLIDLFAAPGTFRGFGIADYREAFRRAADGAGDVQALISACVLRRTRRFLRTHYGRIKVHDHLSDRVLELRFPRRLPPVAVGYDLAGTYGGLFAGLEDWLGELRFPSVDPADRETDDWCEGHGELLKIILLKRLESSVEAFRCTVIQQLAWCDTAIRANRAGRVLTRPDYRASFQGPADDPGSQLALFELMLPAPALDASRIDELRQALEHDMQILAHIHTALSTVGPSGDRKLQRLVELLDGPLAGRKVLVFTEFRDTARYIHHQLRNRPHLAQIDSDRARLGLERASRREILERFAPRSNGLPEPPERERVDLLIATDVLSEGLNLQDASVVVSYDLPWNPVRLMQRVGRIDRLGALAETVELYHFVPADDLDRLLGLMSRLRSKVAAIDSTLGLESPVLAMREGRERASEQIRALARDPDGYDKLELEVEGPLDPEEQAYLDYVAILDGCSSGPGAGIAAGAVRGEGGDGRRAVAYWRVGCGNQRRGLWLVCDLDSGCVVEDQATALRMLRAATAPDAVRAPKRDLTNARRACERYARGVLARLEATRIAGDTLSPGLPQCRLAAWLSRSFRQAAHRLTPEERATIDGLLDRLAQRFSAARERSLARLAARLPPHLDREFLERIDDQLRAFESGTPGPAELEEVATLLLVPAPTS
jgi:superfamily II DNA or RNA helicase